MSAPSLGLNIVLCMQVMIPRAGREVEGHDKTRFKEALLAVGCVVDEESLDDVFKRYDLDGNELIGLEEFKCAARGSSYFADLSVRKELAGRHQSCSGYI